MRWITVPCGNCGAALEAAEDARFLSCSFCKSRLEIVGDTGGYATKLLEDLREKNSRLERQLETANIHSAIAKLDREWEEERRDYMMRGKDGEKYRPTRAGAVVAAVFSILVGCAFFLISAKMHGYGDPHRSHFFDDMWWMDYMGLLPILFGIGMAWVTVSRARAMDEAEAIYLKERRILESRLRQGG